LNEGNEQSGTAGKWLRAADIDHDFQGCHWDGLNDESTVVTSWHGTRLGLNRWCFRFAWGWFLKPLG
jgi:hypothetical protein